CLFPMTCQWCVFFATGSLSCTKGESWKRGKPKFYSVHRSILIPAACSAPYHTFRLTQCRTEQLSRVFLLWLTEKFFRGSPLHDPAISHHYHLMADGADDFQIMTDKEVG